MTKEGNNGTGKKKKKRDGLNDITKAGFFGWIEFVWRGHIVNWFWRPSFKRRNVRETVHMQLLTKSLNRYIPYIKSLKAPQPPTVYYHDDNTKIFSLWLQGIEQAPPIVKSCVESVKRIYPGRLVILDNNNLNEYIQLPDYIEEKWKNGIIIPAHYSDIVRVELLARYGGYWMDVTNFLTGPFPEEVDKSDFFMLRANGDYTPYMFVQNCFIRAKKGDPLLMMWRKLILEYWKNESKPEYYFIVQTLFRLLVTHNSEAKALFDKMPYINMDPTHRLWHEIGNDPYDREKYRKLASETFFQKCSYKPHRHAVNELIPGSMAEVVVSGKGE